MKKLKVKKGSTCMACLACVGACSEAFYKVFDPDKACLQIVEKKAVRPIACPQCGKCAEACPEGAITQNPKGVYMINKKKCIMMRLNRNALMPGKTTVSGIRRKTTIPCILQRS